MRLLFSFLLGQCFHGVWWLWWCRCSEPYICWVGSRLLRLWAPWFVGGQRWARKCQKGLRSSSPSRAGRLLRKVPSRYQKVNVQCKQCTYRLVDSSCVHAYIITQCIYVYYTCMQWCTYRRVTDRLMHTCTCLGTCTHTHKHTFHFLQSLRKVLQALGGLCALINLYNL